MAVLSAFGTRASPSGTRPAPSCERGDVVVVQTGEDANKVSCWLAWGDHRDPG